MNRLILMAVAAMALAASYALSGSGQVQRATAAAAMGPEKKVEAFPDGCRMESFTVPSAAMKRDVRAAVVLPPQYEAEAGERFPVLYALHGRGAPYDTWCQMSPLRTALKDRPMIICCFDGDRAGWYVDSTVKPESQFATFFFDEFMPFIQTHYRTNGVRGVTGFSMGGYGAFHYMLAKPGMFASVSSLSGAFFSDMGERVKELLGDPEEHADAYRRCDIFGRLDDCVTQGVALPPMMIHCGTEDGLLEANRAFEKTLIRQNGRIRQRLEQGITGQADDGERARQADALMAEQRIDFRYVESPGAHNWSFWRDASPGVADFHWGTFQRALARKRG